MKKLYFLTVILITSTLVFGQSSDLYFSMYGEGSNENRFIELFNGTNSNIDMSPYKINIYSNGSSSVVFSLELSGTLKSGDVYVLVHSNSSDDIRLNSDIHSSVTYFNGDDAVELTKNGTSIDVIGIIGEDPGYGWDVAGLTNGTVNRTLTRKSTICSPNSNWTISAGTNENDSEWIVTDIDTEWASIGSHVGCGSTPPLDATLSIFSPINNTVIYTLIGEEAKIELEFSLSNFDLPTDGRIIIKDFDGSGIYVPAQSYPVVLNNYVTIGLGNHTVTLELQDSDNNYLVPPIEATINFSVAEVEDISDLETLRSKTTDDGKMYRVTSEILILHQTTGNYKMMWVRDNSSSIKVYMQGNTDTENEVGNIYQNVIGSLINYRGLLEFIPSDIAEPSLVSTGNAVTPIDVSLADINSGDYESNLVKLLDVNIIDIDGGDGTFQSNNNYTVVKNQIKDSESVVLRTSFSYADYIGEYIPTSSVDLTTIVGKYGDTYQITPISSSDIVSNALNNDFYIESSVSLYPVPASKSLTFKSDIKAYGIFEIFNTSGQLLIYTKGSLSSKTLDVSKLTKGYYILKVSSERESHSYKFSK